MGINVKTCLYPFTKLTALNQVATLLSQTQELQTLHGLQVLGNL